MEQQVVLVDEEDNEVGTAGKTEAHRDAKLHRAFSIFVFNSRGELLLQKRAAEKYHSAGLWANTCCSHPLPGESVADAAHRKLVEEMGFDCDLHAAFRFVYYVQLANGLYEHELDHVLVGTCDAIPAANPREVEAWKWMHPDKLKTDIRSYPERYSYWLAAALDRAVAAVVAPR